MFFLHPTTIFGKDEVLWVDAVKIPGIPFTRFVKNWHVGGYNLFFGNIRQNVNLRVEHYLSEKI